MHGHRVLTHPVRRGIKLNAEAVVEGPYGRVEGAVLLRSAEVEVGQLRIPEVAVEVHPGQAVVEVHQL